MTAQLIATFVAYFSYLLSTVDSSTCCELRTTAADCDAEQNANCLWFAADDPVAERHTLLTDEFQQCFSVEYAACLASGAACCGPCCGGCPPAIVSDPSLANKPPGPPALSECSLGTDTANAVDAGLPAPVGDKIAEDKEPTCSANTRDCWTFTQHSNDNFSPSHIRFLGVDYDTTAGACCYQYTSTFTGTPNCDGKTPEQSHLVFDIDCPVGSFSISDASSNNVGYGLDGSTCYWGIKIDEGCPSSDVCSYNICVEYTHLGPGECPTTTSWVMDKASNVFSFNSLNDGIPSCTNAAMSTPKKAERRFSVDGAKYGSTLVASNELMAGMALLLVLIAGGLVYRSRCSGSYKNEKSVAMLEDDCKQNYSTFNSV